MSNVLFKVAELRNSFDGIVKGIHSYSESTEDDKEFIPMTEWFEKRFNTQSEYSDYDDFCRHFYWSVQHNGVWGRIGHEGYIHSYDQIFSLYDTEVKSKELFYESAKAESRGIKAFIDTKGNWISVSDFSSRRAFREAFVRCLMNSVCDEVCVYECEPPHFSEMSF